MSNAPVTGGKAGWRAEIERFLQERLQTKLDKLKPDDPQLDEVIASFVRDVWLEDAARRVGAALSSLPWVSAWQAKVSHLESLHAHDAVARVAGRND